MVIFKIQTYLDVVSGQKLQKLQKIVFIRSRSYFPFLQRNGASDEKKIYR